MNEGPLRGLNRAWLPWLATAATLDWLVLRTLSRAAIFIPKQAVWQNLFAGLHLLGQLAFAAVGVLALMGILLLAWRGRRWLRGAFGPLLVGMAALSVVHVVVPPGPLSRLAFALGIMVALAALGWHLWAAPGGRGWKVGWSLLAAAAAAAQARHALQAAGQMVGLSDPPLAGMALYAAAEALAVAGGPLLFWMFRAHRSRRAHLLFGLAASLLFSGFYLSKPSLAGIIGIWSMGITLYLPWPLYALSLGMYLAALLAARRLAPGRAPALILLAAGGVAPQLSAQGFMHLLALGALAAPPEARSMVPCPRRPTPPDFAGVPAGVEGA